MTLLEIKAIIVWLAVAMIASVGAGRFCGSLGYAAGAAELMIDRHVDHGFVQRCSCGRAYLRRRNRVFLIEPGTMRPYMRWMLFRGWRPWDSYPHPQRPYR